MHKLMYIFVALLMSHPAVAQLKVSQEQLAKIQTTILSHHLMVMSAKSVARYAQFNCKAYKAKSISNEMSSLNCRLSSSLNKYVELHQKLTTGEEGLDLKSDWRQSDLLAGNYEVSPFDDENSFNILADYLILREQLKTIVNKFVEILPSYSGDKSVNQKINTVFVLHAWLNSDSNFMLMLNLKKRTSNDSSLFSQIKKLLNVKLEKMMELELCSNSPSEVANYDYSIHLEFECGLKEVQEAIDRAGEQENLAGTLESTYYELSISEDQISTRLVFLEIKELQNFLTGLNSFSSQGIKIDGSDQYIQLVSNKLSELREIVRVDKEIIE